VPKGILKREKNKVPKLQAPKLNDVNKLSYKNREGTFADKTKQANLAGSMMVVGNK